MTMYNYIAETNPSMAKAVCHKYGYGLSNCRTKKDLGVCLQQLVASEGESALNDIVLNHPDRDIILELNSKNNSSLSADGCGKHCNCKECRSVGVGAYKDYVAFNGDEVPQENKQPSSVHNNTALVSQTNTFLLASAFLLGIAIIAKKI